MKTKSAIDRRAEYFYGKLGAVVTAIWQVPFVKGLPTWEVERIYSGGSPSGPHRGRIIPGHLPDSLRTAG